MYWKETGDLSVWKGIAQDALIMNVDDLLCVGATDNILLSSTIGRNKNLIPGEVISAIINGTEELLTELELATKEVLDTMETMSEENLAQIFPINVLGYEMDTIHFVTHLYGHLNYHLGQINYHRRLMT